MYKIAILGPESSGKTTLAKKLAKKLPSILIDEYSRKYFSSHDFSKCNLKDLEIIAQNQFDNFSLPKEFNFLISDTEMITMEIWAKDKYSEIPNVIAKLRKKQHFDLYVLSTPDFPWKYDPLRQDYNRRDYLFQIYKQELENSNCTYIIVKGKISNRISTVIEYLNGICPILFTNY